MKYRKKPVVIEATQWFKNGDHPEDYAKDTEGLENGQVRLFTGAERKANDWEGGMVRYFRRPDVSGESLCQHCGIRMHEHGWIDTLEGGHIVCPGDFIITGVQGERYPCKQDIFAKTYEAEVEPPKANVFLAVEANVRYWEDATVNGVEDEEGALIPCRKGDRWAPVIELETGSILGWPRGTTAQIHYKVCDDGEYWLADSFERRTSKWKGDYVPSRFLCVGDNGYGDYIILTVGENGRIEGWKAPSIDEVEWEKCP